MAADGIGVETGGALLLTLLNNTADAQNGTVTADLKTLGLKQLGSARELVSGNAPCPAAKTASCRGSLHGG